MTSPADTSGNRGSWWLDPKLARLAFGSGRVDGSSSGGSRHGLDRALWFAASANAGPLDPAQRMLGDYELLEVIGHGGMGVVYRARQLDLDREVAVKLLSAGSLASDELIDALRREAKHAARLQHPNIVTVHELVEHQDLICYAMQLVRGRSLSEWLAAEAPLPTRQAATLMRTLAEAVDYAHRLGVLHLDLKPGNILINEHGTPLIADFGMARGLEPHRAEEGGIAGTPNHMAPEQVSAEFGPIGPATDVWALGTVLYEMLTGHPPFEAETPGEVLRLVTNGEVRCLSRYRKLPRDLEAICLHCLARHPDLRYPTASALADDLSRFLDGREVSVRPLNLFQRSMHWASRDPRTAIAITAAGIALLAGIATTSLQWRRAEGNALRAARSLGAQRALALQQAYALGRDYAALPGLAENLRDSEARGDALAAAIERRRLGLTLAAYPRLIDRFVLPHKLASVALSPDGRWLAVGTLETSEVWLFDTLDGRQRWRTSLAGEPAFFGSGNFARQIQRLQFSPDGTYLIAGNWWPTPVISPSGMDNWRIDVATGAVARPQRRFPGLGECHLQRGWALCAVAPQGPAPGPALGRAAVETDQWPGRLQPEASGLADRTERTLHRQLDR